MALCFYALLFLTVFTPTESTIISDYLELEQSVLSRNSNIDRLGDAFFPVNRQVAVVVDVYFYYCMNPSENNTECSNLKLSDPNDAESWHNVTEMYKFGWSASFVTTFIRPNLLRDLSLFTYSVSVTKARVVIDQFNGDNSFNNITSNCNKSAKDSEQVCQDPPSYLKMLNRFTANAIKSMALHRHSLDEFNEEERGHSVYYFCPVEYHDDFCVLGYEKSWYVLQRNILASALVFVAVAISLLTPAILTATSVYDMVHNNAKKESSNLRFVFLAVILVLFFLNSLLLLYRLIRDGKYYAEKKSFFGDVVNLYILRLVFFLVLPFFDIFVTLCYCSGICSGICSRKCKSPLKENFPSDCPPINKFLQGFEIVTIQIFLQLLIFHAVYILLGFIASPIQVLSIGALYAAGMTCVITCSTLFLKYVHFYVTSNKSNENLTHLTIFGFFVVFFSGVSFLIFAGLIIAFIHRTILASGDYRNPGGVESFITAMFPVAMVALLGYAGKQFISGNIMRNDNEPQTANPAPTPPPPIDDSSINRGGPNAAAGQDHEERPLLDDSSSARPYGSADTTQ